MMQQINRYAYSFDRETFRGEYATREAALAAGLKAAEELGGAVEAIYVGRQKPVDPQADDHADNVIRAMRRRMLEKTGDANFLSDVNEHVSADLDTALAVAIKTWLKRNNLEPAVDIGAVSEHPLPTVPNYAATAAVYEVKLLGPQD